MENITVKEQLEAVEDQSQSIKTRLRSAKGRKTMSEGRQTPTEASAATVEQAPVMPALMTPVQWSNQGETTPERKTSSAKRRDEKRYETAEAEEMMRRSYQAALEERDTIPREEFDRQASARIKRLKEGLSPEIVTSVSKSARPDAGADDAISYHRIGGNYYKRDEQAEEQDRFVKVEAWDVPWDVLLKHGIPGDLTDADAEAETAKRKESATRKGSSARTKMVSPRAFSLFKPVKQGSDELVPELALSANTRGKEDRQSGKVMNQRASEAALREELTTTMNEFCTKMKSEFRVMLESEKQKWKQEQDDRHEEESRKKRKTTETGSSLADDPVNLSEVDSARFSENEVTKSERASESASVESLRKELSSLREVIRQQEEDRIKDEKKAEVQRLQQELETLKQQVQRSGVLKSQEGEGSERKADEVTRDPEREPSSGVSSIQHYRQSVKLPKFNGTNFYSFINIFETNAKLRKWNNEERLAWFLPCIEGEARLYLETEPDEMLSYERVKRSMEERYGNRYSTFDVKRQIRTLKRERGESIESFADRLQSVAQTGKIDKTDKCELFYRAFLDAVEDEPKLQMYIEKEHDKNRQARLPDLLKMVREYRERSPERSVREKSVNVCQSFDKRKGSLRHEDPNVQEEVRREGQKVKEERRDKVDRSDRILRNDVDYNTGEVEFLKRVIKANGLHINLKEKLAQCKDRSFHEPMGELPTESDWARIRQQQKEARNRRFGRQQGRGYGRPPYVGAHERDDANYSTDEEDESRDNDHRDRSE